MASDPAGCPTKDEQADYLEGCSRRFELPVVLNTALQRLEQVAGGFRSTARTGSTIESRVVVVAPGLSGS